ncbi:MAG: prepilin-type N-terminal cleavage/methylation domain-containing protein [bacterium]|nr:prepilin-type N-terminal cleavage/methylation domain-containing protein [bacterium]
MRNTVNPDQVWEQKNIFEKGYSLIEMAIVISVVGLIMASFISAYTLYMKTTAQQTTENNLTLLTSKMGNFLVAKGRYPCPARIDVLRSDVDYGFETECNSALTAVALPAPSYPVPPPTPGTCLNGLCYELGATLVDKDPSTANDTASPLGFGLPMVRRGAIPFRTMGIPEEITVDGWGNRFQFAVAENMAVATTYAPKGGGVEVFQDRTFAGPNSKRLTPLDNFAHYIIISSGPDRAGAYSNEGKLVAPCGTVGYDRENCNTPGNPLPYYVSGEHAPKPGAEHFDDYVQFYSSVESPLWSIQDEQTGYHIRDLIQAEATGQVGIGVAAPATNAKVQVSDEVRIDNGSLLADRVCDSSSLASGCMNTREFAQGDLPFQCPPGEYAVAFGGDLGTGKLIKCAAATGAQCGKGEVMIGIDYSTNPRGVPKCTSLLACAAQSVTLCSGTAAQATLTINPDTVNKTWASGNIGSNYNATYTCQGSVSGTSWNRTSETGACVCTAIDEYNDQTCNSYIGYGNWTGVVTRHHTNICPGNIDSTVISANTCACSPTTETQLAACAPGLTGNITQTRDWICDTPTSGHWTGWTNIADNCLCTPTTTPGTQNCQPWETGIITGHTDTTCPGPVVGPWVVDSNTCTCFAKTEDTYPTCPFGQSGTIVKRRTYDCATNSWGGYVEISNSCACSGGSESTTEVCPGPYDQGIITKQRTLDCATLSYGPYSVISNTCSCVTPPPQARTVTCPAPLLGNIIESRNYDCGTGAWSAWTEAQNNCGVVAYFWATKSSATGPFGSPLTNQAGASCPTAGTMSSCSAATGGGNYMHYAACQCE